MHPTSIFIFALLPVCDGLFGLGRLQSVAVTGTLRCNGKPASRVSVKLSDKEIFHSKELKKGRTNQNGTFYLSGSKREFSHIEPFVNVYHTCNYDGPCLKKRKFKIPVEYVTYGPFPNYTFDLGIKNLDGIYSDQWIVCTNRSIDRNLLLNIEFYAPNPNDTLF
ncbi:Transthyretin protein 5 [Trichostrongylus colubriformis]|uniref:Transthyretin protein 5 n=1 Tax=Trichostrongylus colubriformis TaxID=6319 RepID=A0AAN8ETA3_TRICO